MVNNGRVSSMAGSSVGCFTKDSSCTNVCTRGYDVVARPERRCAPHCGGGRVKTPKVTDLRQQPVIMLRRAVQATSAHWQDHIHEATPPQYSVMLVLSDNPGIRLAQVTALTLI